MNMKLLIIILLILILIIVEVIREQMTFVVKEYSLDTSNRAKGRIMFISDLHSKSYGRDNSRLIGAAASCAPDLILLGGDMIVSSHMDRSDVSLEFIKKLADIAPVYYGMGNHETRLLESSDERSIMLKEYLKKLSAYGVKVLDNQSTVAELNGSGISVTGLSIPGVYYKKTVRRMPPIELVRNLIGERDADRYEILLAHNPGLYKLYEIYGADLTLCGHYHGGVIRFGHYGVITPDLNIFDAKVYGRFSAEDHEMIVTSGAGIHTLPLRLFNSAEIVVIDLK